MNLSWENVYIFISSTFNDMHAERDYLVKRVFPELSEWCEERRLRLMDIDLRWGVTEKDSQKNKRVVDVCLSGIDRCRPLFLCFLGQRRGWVPGREDIAETTFSNFPKLSKYLGSSVTELEIIHALVDPMLNGSVLELQNRERAFFFRREDSYLADITDQEVRNIYTNEGDPDPAQTDRKLLEFQDTIVQSGRPFHTYQAKWDKNAKTPELLVPGKSETIADGRLTGFTCEGEELSAQILKELKEAISGLYPDRAVSEKSSLLQKELDEQAKFVQAAREGFIEREGDFDQVSDYLKSDDLRPFAVCAPAGMGKTSWLARLVEKLSERETGEILYRFVGTSEASVSLGRMLVSIAEELKERFCLKAVPSSPQKIKDAFYDLLSQASKEKPLVVIVDAINQLDCGLEDLSWIPEQLPDKVKFIFSFKIGVPDGDTLYQELSSKNTARTHILRGFENKESRAAIVKQYLSLYLKELDEKEIETIISMEGSSNPLYLKVLLSELKVYGSHEGLHSLIETRFGKTAKEAFLGVLKRLETDPGYSPVPAKDLTVNMFGWLSNSKNGLEPDELTDLLVDHQYANSKEDAQDSVNLILRQLRPFLAKRDKRQDFFYESFMLAAKEYCSLPENGGKQEKEWHKELALYFKKRNFADPRKLSEQAYHYAYAGMGEELKKLLVNYNYLERRIFHTGVQELLEDYLLITLPQAGIEKAIREELLLIREALEMGAPVISRGISQLPTQLFGRLMGFDLPLIKTLLEDTEKYKEKYKVLWFKPLCSFLPQPGGHMIRYIKTPVQDGACMFRDRKRLILYSTVDKAIQIIEISTGKVLRSYPFNSAPAWICLAEDEKVLAIRFMSRLDFLDLATGKTYPGENVSGVNGNAFDIREGKLVQTGLDLKTKIRTTYITEIATGKLLYSYDSEFTDKDKYVSTVVFDRTTGYLLQTIEDQGISVMDPRNGFKEIKQYKNDPKNIRTSTAHFNRIITPDSYPLIITITEFDGLTFYDKDSGEVLLHERLFGAWLVRYNLSADHKFFVLISFKNVNIYSLETKELIASFTRSDTNDNVSAVAFSPDNQRLYICLDKGKFEVYDIESGAKLKEYTESRSSAKELFLNEDESRLVSFNSGEVVIWDLKKAVTKAPDPGITDFRFDAFALAPNDKFMIVNSSSEGGAIWRFEIPSMERKVLVKKIGGHYYSANVYITPDSKYFAVQSKLSHMNFFDCETGELIAEMDAVDAEKTGDEQAIKIWDPLFLPKDLSLGEHGLTMVYHQYGNLVIQDPEAPEKTKVVKAFPGNVSSKKLFDGGYKLAAYSGNSVYDPDDNVFRSKKVPGLEDGAKVFDMRTMECIFHSQENLDVFQQAYELKDYPEFVKHVAANYKKPSYARPIPQFVSRNGEAVYYYMPQVSGNNRYVLYKRKEARSVCLYLNESATTLGEHPNTKDGRYFFLKFGTLICPLELVNRTDI